MNASEPTSIVALVTTSGACRASSGFEKTVYTAQHPTDSRISPSPASELVPSRIPRPATR